MENPLPNRPTALVVEDDDKLATIFAQAMKTAGYDIQVAFDGQKAIAMLAHLEPSAIILDVHLPGASGEVVLNHIRNESRLKDAVVVLATADSLMADHLRDQSDFVLLKPVSFNQLRDLGVRILSSIKC